MQTEERAIPTCPACHIGCQLTSWQCGRGKRICETWQETGKLPERGPRGPKGGAGKPGGAQGGPQGKPGEPQGNATPQQRIVKGITFLPRAMKRCSGQSVADSVLTALSQRGGVASTTLLVMETAMLGTKLQQGIDEAVAAGHATTEQADGTTYVHLTEAGKTRVAEAREELKAANATFFECLSAEEQEQLAALLEKALQANKPQNMRR